MKKIISEKKAVDKTERFELKINTNTVIESFKHNQSMSIYITIIIHPFINNNIYILTLFKNAL